MYALDQARMNNQPPQARLGGNFEADFFLLTARAQATNARRLDDA